MALLTVSFFVRLTTLASLKVFRPCGEGSLVREATLILSTLLRRILLAVRSVLGAFFSAIRTRRGLVKVAALFCSVLPFVVRRVRSPVTVVAGAGAGFGLSMGEAMRAVRPESIGPTGLAGFVKSSGDGLGLLTTLAGRATAFCPFGLLNVTVLCPPLSAGDPFGFLAIKEPRVRLAASKVPGARLPASKLPLAGFAALKLPSAGLEALKGAGGAATFGREEFAFQDCCTPGGLVLLKFPELRRFAWGATGLERVGCERWTAFVGAAGPAPALLTC